MVGRQHQQQRIALVGRQRRMRRQRDRRRGVAPRRLEHDRARLAVDRAQLLGHQKAVRLVAHHDRGADRQAREPAHGLLQHGVAAHQRQQLLGIELARQRPQPGAGTARENHRN